MSTEPGSDVICLGDAELGVKDQCMLPMVAGLLILAVTMMAFGQITVYACRMIGESGLGRQSERRSQLDACGSGLAGFVQGFAQRAERVYLAVMGTELSVQSERLPEVAEGLLMVVLAQADQAQACKCVGYADGLINAAVDGQGLLEEGVRPGERATAEAELAH
jgi:hypothetical protein